MFELVPDVMGPDSREPRLRWSDRDGHVHRSGAAILVSNNHYRLGHAVDSELVRRSTAGRLGSRSSTEAGPSRTHAS